MTDTISSADDLRFYERAIVEDTGCAPEDAPKVETIMRDDVFHSTLDWQSRPEFRRGARRAYRMLQENRADYEQLFDTFQRAYEGFIAQSAAEKARTQPQVLAGDAT